MKHQLLQGFLKEWPVERLQKMSLEEYSNTNKTDSFCYWVEFKTKDLGSIKGGSSFKFNTSDIANRSVETFDMALTRRFCFQEILPNPKLIAQADFTVYSNFSNSIIYSIFISKNRFINND